MSTLDRNAVILPPTPPPRRVGELQRHRCASAAPTPSAPSSRSSPRPRPSPWWRLRSADGRWAHGSAGDRARPEAADAVESLATAEGIVVTDGVASPDNRVAPQRLAKRVAKLATLVTTP